MIAEKTLRSLALFFANTIIPTRIMATLARIIGAISVKDSPSSNPTIVTCNKSLTSLFSSCTAIRMPKSLSRARFITSPNARVSLSGYSCSRNHN